MLPPAPTLVGRSFLAGPPGSSRSRTEYMQSASQFGLHTVYTHVTARLAGPIKPLALVRPCHPPKSVFQSHWPVDPGDLARYGCCLRPDARYSAVGAFPPAHTTANHTTRIWSLLPKKELGRFQGRRNP